MPITKLYMRQNKASLQKKAPPMRGFNKYHSVTSKVIKAPSKSRLLLPNKHPKYLLMYHLHRKFSKIL